MTHAPDDSLQALAERLHEATDGDAARILSQEFGTANIQSCELATLIGQSPRVATTDMVLVSGGSFVMGCGNDDPDCTSEPKHSVMLSPFEIDKHEVTERQYEACVQAGVCEAIEYGDCSTYGDWRPGHEQHGDVPATCVTWTSANKYCEWTGKRLPTEAEWEKAARGTDGRVYPWGNSPPTCARAYFADCGPDNNHLPAELQPVGDHRRPPSPYGVYDMAGNVAEWTNDRYARYPAAGATDPTGPVNGLGRVARGGSWASGSASAPLDELRADFRSVLDENQMYETVGMRCARSVLPSATSRTR